MTDPTTLRAAAYAGRRAIRATAGVDGYIRRHQKRWGPGFTKLVRQFTEVLPPLLVTHCIAEAESQAINIINVRFEP